MTRYIITPDLDEAFVWDDEEEAGNAALTYIAGSGRDYAVIDCFGGIGVELYASETSLDSIGYLTIATLTY